MSILDKKGLVNLHINNADKYFLLCYRQVEIYESQLAIINFEINKHLYAILFQISIIFHKQQINTGSADKLQGDINILNQKGKFIFWIDCSGSMNEKICMKDSFNFTRIASRRYLFQCLLFWFKVQEILWTRNSSGGFKIIGIQMTNAILAEMGGKKPLNRLKDIFGQPPIMSYPRNVFLLADTL